MAKLNRIKVALVERNLINKWLAEKDRDQLMFVDKNLQFCLFDIDMCNVIFDAA